MGHTVHSADIADFPPVTYAYHEQAEDLGVCGTVYLGVSRVVSAATHRGDAQRPHGSSE